MKNLKSKRSERQIGFLRFEDLLKAKEKYSEVTNGTSFFRIIVSCEKETPPQEFSYCKIKSRLQLAELAYEESHPIILPQCHVTSLLVKF